MTFSSIFFLFFIETLFIQWISIIKANRVNHIIHKKKIDYRITFTKEEDNTENQRMLLGKKIEYEFKENFDSMSKRFILKFNFIYFKIQNVFD